MRLCRWIKIGMDGFSGNVGVLITSKIKNKHIQTYTNHVNANSGVQATLRGYAWDETVNLALRLRTKTWSTVNNPVEMTSGRLMQRKLDLLQPQCGWQFTVLSGSPGFLAAKLLLEFPWNAAKKGLSTQQWSSRARVTFPCVYCPPCPPRANNMLINHATHFNQNPLELFPCNCIKYSNNMLCYQMCEIIKWKWTGLCEQNSWAKTHCSHPQHSIHQWVSYHGVLVFQYAEHTVPPKHGHTMAQKGTNGIKWTQFLHCSCSDWRPFQSQWFSFLIFPIQYLVTKSLSQDNLKRPVCNEGTTRLVRWPSDLKQQPPRDNILRTCKGLVRLMENAGSAVTSVTQPSCPTATSADLSCSSFKLSFKINSRITSTCGVVFGLRWHALTYSLNLVDILRVQKVSCKLHWSK